jgi:hypothetical protein
MNRQFRINVWKNKRLWCRIETDCPWADEVVYDLLTKLLVEEGYSFEFFMATDERRIIESSKDGVRLLVREPIYKPISIADLLHSEFKK